MTDKLIKELIEYPTEGVFSKVLNEGTSETTLFCMAKDTTISDHTSTRNGIVYVYEGNGVFKLGQKEIKMEAGRIIFMPANAVHSLKAEENTSFLLILN